MLESIWIAANMDHDSYCASDEIPGLALQNAFCRIMGCEYDKNNNSSGKNILINYKLHTADNTDATQNIKDSCEESNDRKEAGGKEGFSQKENSKARRSHGRRHPESCGSVCPDPFDEDDGGESKEQE
jgi:hypothetical protein